MAKTTVKDPPTHYWFIFNPNSLTPPTKQFNNPKVAAHVADELAKKHIGEKFYVMHVQYVSATVYHEGIGWEKETF